METGSYEVTVCNHESISIVLNNDTDANWTTQHWRIH
jgi:hypothetical protein